MHICSEGKDKVTDGRQENDHGLPVFTVIGGILGALAATATGALIAVPVAAIVGIAADLHGCDLCGQTLDEDDPGYNLLEQTADSFGNVSYRPLGTPPKSPAPSNPMSSSPTASRSTPSLRPEDPFASRESEAGTPTATPDNVIQPPGEPVLDPMGEDLLEEPSSFQEMRFGFDAEGVPWEGQSIECSHEQLPDLDDSFDASRSDPFDEGWCFEDGPLDDLPADPNLPPMEGNES